MVETPKHQYLIWQCSAPACALRFPAAVYEGTAGRCPVCGGPAEIAARPSHAQGRHQDDRLPRPLPHLELLLDNIRSTYNIGSIFRTADGAGVTRLHLSGISATPDHPKVAKTALGAAGSLLWDYHRNGVTAARVLLEEGATLWALEETPPAEPLLAIGHQDLPARLVLVVGNEVVGIDPDIMALCARVVALPMIGIKESLNVTVACGVAVYHLLHGRL